MPELSLSLDLHLHHSVVGVLDALQGLLDAREQIDDLLLADQDLAVGARSRMDLCRGSVILTAERWFSLGGGGCLSPQVRVQVFEDLVLVLDRLDDGHHHLRAVTAHIRLRC